MEDSFYLPILKAKTGEFTALAKLGLTAKKKIVPVFEVTPLEWDHSEQKKPKTLQDHLTSFCKKFVSKWSHDNCFIDTTLLNWNGIDNTPKIELIYELLHKEGLSPLPMFRINSSKEFIDALNRSFNGEINEAGLRVDLNDATSADFEANIVQRLDSFGLEASNTHLVFDLKDSNFSEVDNFSDGLLDLLENFPFVNIWKTFTVAGTAFPESSKIKSGLWEFDRNEWKLYNTLVEKLSTKEWNRKINFGDYSIINPTYFEFDPKKMSSSANIKYTLNGKWIVAKGHALKTSLDYLQYKKLANDIYSTPHYLGEGFSEGSLYLAKCVRGEVKNGNPTTWNWVGNNHHFTRVLFDLFSILPGS